jgi:hypothetical protein
MHQAEYMKRTQAASSFRHIHLSEKMASLVFALKDGQM